ncbi:MAG TPA: NorD protein [Saprospirales bacterium]|nr:NorD protein [Saprospirales bacterium]HAY70351.1 NorD protein [Saprospirales bacterium]HRQ29342.1 VWA domain-containing protein [Saprospiraceae bacterium]
MGLDEYIYGKISNYYRRKKEKLLQQQEQTVTLESLKPRLMLIARALTGEEIEIFPAEKEGGCRDLFFFLPEMFYAFDKRSENERFYLFRTLYLVAQHRSGINWKLNESYPDAVSREKAEEMAPLILAKVFDEFPAYEQVFEELKKQLDQENSKVHPFDKKYLYGKLMTPKGEKNGQTGNAHHPDKQTGKHNPMQAKTSIKAKNNVENIESLQVNKKQQQDATIYHDLEKLRTADEFGGNWKDFDGEDELDQHKEALKELRMQYTVRVNDDVHSVYQSEFVENARIAEIADVEDNGKFWTYDEWDHSQHQYKTAYCKVFPKNSLQLNRGYYAETIAHHKTTLNILRKSLVSYQNKMKQVNLQRQGDDFDLDAVTDFSVDIMSGHSPSENIYIDKQKKEKDLSILLLLDHSLSSDSYVMNNRVIDVEKQVSILFGEILHEFKVDFGIAAFHSKTRNHIHFVTLKQFDESWQRSKLKIGSLQPEGYTRIGAPLRHASALLQKRDSKNRWIVLLSDGKPNDYDRYEGKYGLQDIKQALKEMKAVGIHTYALAIEKQAKYYLPLMFGHNHYQILSSPTELLHALIKLYERIRYQQ